MGLSRTAWQVSRCRSSETVRRTSTSYAVPASSSTTLVSGPDEREDTSLTASMRVCAVDRRRAISAACTANP
jgi:hypothetical protein